MPSPNKHTAYRVRKWLEAGNIGTAAQIARAIRSYSGTVFHALETLERQGHAKPLKRCSDGLLWAFRSADDCGPVLRVALSRRTPIELAWAHPAPRPHMEQCT